MHPFLPELTRAVFRAHWRSRRYRAHLSVHVVAAGIMAFVPLFHELGFGFSFVMALITSLASLDLSCAFMKQARIQALAWTAPTSASALPAASPRQAISATRLLASLLWTVTRLNLCLLLAPLALIALNSLRVRTCDWAFGLKAYALMPGLSSVLATAVGLLVATALPRLYGPARGRLAAVGAGALPYLLFVGVVAWAVWRFYAAPPVFSYAMFAGYFPGNLYDESIELREPFYWARLYQIAALAAAFFAACALFDPRSFRLRLPHTAPRIPGRARAAVLAVGCTALAAALDANAAKLGFSIDLRDIQHHLGGRYDTEHFVIYYPPGDDIERDIHLIAEEHEYRYAQVVDALGLAPDEPGRITSLYFASAADKHRMMGAGQVYMAKPWRREIYLNHADFPHQILRHEIAHAVAGEFGSPVFRVSAASILGLPLVFNVGLIEGIAVAADWPDHFTPALTPHESVKAMDELGFTPPLSSVLSTGFLAFSSARSYTIAGSFVRYLLDEHGPAPLRELYRTGGDFMHAYGVTQAEMVGRWRSMIAAIELPPRTAEVVRERFRRPGIFSRPCPHAIARMRDRIGELIGRGAGDDAIRLLRKVCALAPHEPSYAMELASVLAMNLFTDQARKHYTALAENAEEISSTLRARAYIALAAIAARSSDLDTTRRILDTAATLPLPEDEARIVAAQRFVASHRGPATAPLRAYFWGDDPRLGSDSMVLLGRAALVIQAEPELGLGHYLLGRLLIGRGAPAEAAAALKRSLDRGLPHPLLLREAARQLATAAYRAGDYALVEVGARILLQAETATVSRLYGADWLERLHWKRTGTLLRQP